MKTATSLLGLTLLILAFAAPAAVGQCVKSEGGVEVELLIDGQNSGGTYTYVWGVSFSGQERYVSDLYFQREEGSITTSTVVEPIYSTWTEALDEIPGSEIDAVHYTWQSGLKLQRNRNFTFSYTTTFQDPVRVVGVLSDLTTFDNTFTSSECSILPVELVSFDATADGEAALLSWKTASETGNAGFYVEHRLATSPSFAEIGFVEGAGTTAVEQTYSYRAAALAPGRHLFRLRQVDHDGRFAYGPEVELEVGMQEAFRVGAPYPNPIAAQARFDLSVQRTQRVAAQAFDALGRMVANVFDGEIAASASEVFTLDGSSLAPGVYMLRVTGETFQHTQPFTIVR